MSSDAKNILKGLQNNQLPKINTQPNIKQGTKPSQRGLDQHTFGLKAVTEDTK